MMMRIVILFMIGISLVACSREEKIKDGHLITVKAQTPANTLFYSGSIQPIQTQVIPCLADGMIVDMPFQYGDEVKAGQLLFVIASTKFLTDYKSALMQYIKAKNEFNNSKTQLQEAEFLHQHELISDDDYKMKQSNFYSNQLALLQAKDALEILLKQLNIKNKNFDQLAIADINKITQAMKLEVNADNHLQIMAPISGVILSESKDSGENKKILKGDAVKQGDVLGIIGDMSGLRVRIKVNELTINQLKVKQKVKVTGIAFPNEVLDGEIEQIDRQAESTNNGLPTFSIDIIVPKLSPEQQKLIHVGMSAKVEMTIEEAAQIMVPLNALNEKHGQYYIKLYDTKKETLHEAAISPGKTTSDAVAILSGLKPGDRIVVPD